EQRLLGEEMRLRRLPDLGGRGEMDEAVTDVVRAAAIDALPFSLAPGGRGTNFIARAHESEMMAGVFEPIRDRIGRSGLTQGRLGALARLTEVDLFNKRFQSLTEERRL